jgi:hypothetical protein
LETALLVVAATGVQACAADTGPSLFVDLQTDLVPNVEFTTVRLELRRAGAGAIVRSNERDVSERVDFSEPRRVSELESLDVGDYTLRLQLLDAGMTIAASTIAVQLTTSRGLTIPIQSSCADVTCPPLGGDPTRGACIAGSCADSACLLAGMESCGLSECQVDTDCSSAVACARPACVGGLCFEILDDDRCAPGTRCDRESGCEAAPADAGPSDAALSDAEADGGIATPDAAVPDGLVTYYSFEEDPAFAGVIDHTGHGYHGTCDATACPTPVPTASGMAARFDGVDDRIRVPFVDSGRWSELTVTAWVRPRSSDPTTPQYIVGKPFGTGTLNSFGLYFYGWASSDQQLNFAIADVSNADRVTRSPPGDPNVWVFLAGTFDGSTIRLYAEGEELGSLGRPGAMSFDDHQLVIGADENGASRDVESFFDGDIDELRIYDRALSPTELDSVALLGRP